MPQDMTVTFLGSTSGGGPTETRNCSSLVLDALGDGSLWMVDCAEGTVRQFAQQPHKDYRRVKMSKLTKIFITHMHADHTMGLITVLRNILGIPKFWTSHSLEASQESPTVANTRDPRPPRVEVYGPAGIRSFVRDIFNLTHTRTDAHYCVHELLFPHEVASAPCTPVELMHGNEEAGMDIFPDVDGFWRDITEEKCGSGGARVTVDVGPIVHRDPCLGYVFRERLKSRTVPLSELAEGTSEDIIDVPYSGPAPRTIVILGDTSDASALIPLLFNDPECRVSLLVHEATDCYMPPHIDKYGTTGRNRTTESVKEKAIEKGHSTPAMAGAFAQQIGAERLVLNHIGSRFPAAPHHIQNGGDRFRANCIREIERQATEAWKPPNGVSAIAAWDFCAVRVPPNTSSRKDREEASQWDAVSQTVVENVWEDMEEENAQSDERSRSEHRDRQHEYSHYRVKFPHGRDHDRFQQAGSSRHSPGQPRGMHTHSHHSGHSHERRGEQGRHRQYGTEERYTNLSHTEGQDKESRNHKRQRK